MVKIEIPPVRPLKTSIYEKSFYYFKDVRLGPNGFEFDGITELTVDDGIPLSNKSTSKDHRKTAINDFYIVQMNNTRYIATIILRKNLKYDTDFPHGAAPVLIPQEEFEDMENGGEIFDFYKFCKIISSEVVRVRFTSPVLKVVLNGDQIIFMQTDRVVVYTLFSSSEIKVKALDIAVSRYLYILTEDSILVYSDKLIRKIEVDTVFKFIVPTPLYILAIRHGQIYKITDEEGELYFEQAGDIISCGFDERYMYFATRHTLYRIGLYDPNDVAALRTEMPAATVNLCRDYVVLYNSNSGVMYIDKTDFSRFCRRNLALDMCDLTAYDNTIVYACIRDIMVCNYVTTPTGLQKVGLVEAVQDTVAHPKMETVEHVLSAMAEYCGPRPYTFYGQSVLSRRKSRFSNLLGYKTSEEALQAVQQDEVSRDEVEMSQMIGPTPLSQPPCTNPYESLFSKNEKFVDDQYLSPVRSPVLISEAQQKVATKEMKRITRFIQKQIYTPDDPSSDSESGLFFEEADNAALMEISHPVLRSVQKAVKPKRRHRAPGQTRMLSVFKGALAKTGLTHPVTLAMPLKRVRVGDMDDIILGKMPKRYDKSHFFVKNHFEYFKNRFEPRSTEEKPYRGVMYAFINEELRRITSGRNGITAKIEKRVEVPKAKRGGF